MCAELVFRRGTPEDSRPAFDLSMAAVGDLFARQNHPLPIDPEAFWGVLQPFLDHLADHAVGAQPAAGRWRLSSPPINARCSCTSNAARTNPESTN